MANTLHELGYRRLRATGLKGRHVEALVREWRRQGLSVGTMKNRMSHLRWWAQRISKPNVVRADNASYGIGERQRVTNEGRSRDLPEDRLALVRDARVRMALRLQAPGVSVRTPRGYIRSAARSRCARREARRAAGSGRIAGTDADRSGRAAPRGGPGRPARCRCPACRRHRRIRGRRLRDLGSWRGRVLRDWILDRRGVDQGR